MKTPLPRSLAACALAIAFLLASGIPRSASAQTTYNATLYNNVTAIYGSIYPNTSPHFDAINFATGNGTNLDVDQDVSFSGSTLSAVFTSTAFTSTGGRVSASMVGTDEFTIPVAGRTFIVQNFALDNVDFTTSNSSATGDVGLRIQGPGGLNTSLTLANSTLNCAITPHFYVPSALTFNVSGTSRIAGWGHDIQTVASTTALTVASGGSLTIKDCGDLTATVSQMKLYFSQYTNTATLNASSLVIDNSALVFGANPFGDQTKESTMTFSNNATLQLTSVGTPGSSVETDNLILQNSAVNMGANTRLKLRNTLDLNNSSASVATGAQADIIGITAKGNATVSLGIYALFNAETLDIKNGATLSVAGSSYDIGEMKVSRQVLFPASGTGTLAVGSLAVLSLSNGATMDLTSHAALTANDTIDLQDGRMTVRQGTTFTNNIQFIVQEPSLVSIDGNLTIGGHGTIDMRGTLTFANSTATPAANSLSVYSIGLESPVTSLTTNSTLQLVLNPSSLTSDRLVVSHQFDLESRVALNLSLVNDTALALGTKFLLVNYPSSQTLPTQHFVGLADGAWFSLGLNTYQINYNDPGVQPGETHFITVTTVPEPGTLALLGLGGLTLLVCARCSAARKAALALFLAASLCQVSQASIIWSGAVDINIPSNLDGVYLDVVTGDFSTSPLSHTDLHAYVAGGSLLSFDSDFGGLFGGNGFLSGISGQGGVNNLPVGYMIGPSHVSWSQDNITNAPGQTTSPYWTPNSTSNLVGFRFDDGVTSDVRYGWTRISLASNYSSQPMSIVSYAYESLPNTAIAAGAVPEPAALVLLGLGSVFLVARALRRRQARRS